MKPYAHQVAGTRSVRSRDATAIMADPGTGKTKIVIDALEDARHILVLCPVSVKYNWLEELGKHAPDWDVDICVLEKQKEFDAFISRGSERKLLIVGIESLSQGKAYERCVKFTKKIASPSWMIIDESHLIKNHSAKRTTRATMLGARYDRRVTMTGTPTSGKLVDLFAQFRFLEPELLGTSFYRFRSKYCIMGGFEGREVVGYQNVDQLQAKIDRISFRARKEDCLDLPPKVYEVRRVPLTTKQKGLYKKLEKQLIMEVNQESFSVENALIKLLRCQQVCSGIARHDDMEEDIDAPKIGELIKIIEGTNKPIVIWTKFRREQERILNRLEREYPGETVVVNADVVGPDRQKAVNAMQNGEARFYLSTYAGGVGVTVTAASLEVFVSNDFSSIKRTQAEDRCHRSGQKNTVTIIDILADDTVDEYILNSLRDKKNVTDGVLKGSLRQ